MEVVLSLCAFVWHLGDAALSTSKSRKNAKKFWAGVGVGWSAFFLGVRLYEHYKTHYVETVPTFESGYMWPDGTPMADPKTGKYAKEYPKPYTRKNLV